MRSSSLPEILRRTSALSPRTDSKGSATTKTSLTSSRVIFAATYVTSGLTAIAVLETKVQGVVVQTKKAAFRSASGPDVAGKRT